MHPLVCALVGLPDGAVNDKLFLALRTTLSLDDAYDLLEIRQVHASAQAALNRNLDEAQAANQAEQERQRPTRHR